MPPVELIKKRTRNSKTHSLGGNKYSWDGTIGSIHYKDNPDDPDELFKEIEPNIQPSDKPDWDWEVVKGHWRLLIKNDATFAAVKEGNWLGFKLIDIGYLEITTKNYVRLNLKQDVIPEVNGNEIAWANLFPKVNFKIIYTNDRLQERIEFTQDARDWCGAHPPSSYGLSNANSYLVLLYECDWSGSHPAQTEGGVIDWNVDWETEKPIWFTHPIKNQIFTALPASHARHQDFIDEEDTFELEVTLRKRFIKYQDKNYLLIGAPVLALNAMPSGSIIFDSPDVDEEVENGNDDATEKGSGTFYLTLTLEKMYSNTSPTSSSYYCFGIRFRTVDIPQGQELDVAYASLYATASLNDDPNGKIYGNDVNDSNDFNTEQDVIGRARTGEYTSWVADNIGYGAYKNTPSLINPIEEVIGRAGWVANNNLTLLFIANTDQTKRYTPCSYEHAENKPPKLHIEYTAGGPTPNQFNKILYTSEPPTANAWNQVKQDTGTGWKKLLYV